MLMGNRKGQSGLISARLKSAGQKRFGVMQRLILLVALHMAAGASLYPQTAWELGVRAGDKFGLDATIPLSSAPRLHPSLYFFEKYVAGGLYFDWLFNIEGTTKSLKFYPGIGPEIYMGPEIELAVAGNFGAEYSFDFPLTVGIDWRPGVYLSENLKWRAVNIGIMARLRFGDGLKFTPAE